MAGQILPVAGVWLLLWIAMVAWADWRLANQNVARLKKKTAKALFFKRPGSVTFWTLEWLFREKGLTLLICKSGAALFSIATLLYYGTGKYDIRLPAVGLSFSVLMNIGISYEIYQWETSVWQWGRSLTVSFLKRVANLVLLHFLVLLPDFLLIARYGSDLLTFADLLHLALLQLSFLLWYHSTLYRKDRLLEDTLGMVFPVFILLTLLILYKIPLPALYFLLLSYSGWRYSR